MKKSDTIDIMRVLMAYVIAIYHLFLIGIVIFPGGGIGTEFFFMVTGALMNRSLCKNDELRVWPYISRKFCKILPLFLITTIATFFIKEIIENVGGYRIPIDFLQNFFEFIFLRMFGWAEVYYINPVTWYLSAVLFATLLLYPIARKHRKECADFIFPLISIALFSYLVKQYGTVVTVSVKYSFFTLDLVKRAIAEVCFGFSMFEVAMFISNKKFTRIGSIILKAIESLGYLSVLVASVFSLDVHYSVWIIFVLGISIAISFSAKGLQVHIKKDSVRSFLPVYSLSLYLSHYAILLICGKVKLLWEISPAMTIVIYLLFVTLIAAINVGLVRKMDTLIAAIKNRILIS